MRDKVFLIWSGTITVARKIKDILEKEYNYVCDVGGNSDNKSQMVSIGDTVIRQMKTCNQAIVLFKNKDDGGVSRNLFFELGYVSSQYGMKKVHCVKRKNESIVLPSDFDNSFVEGIEGETDDEFARNVVDYFLSRQKLSVDTNKMFLINNRYLIKEKIAAQYSETGSKCSDYELAQYILFYTHAAIMFQDPKKRLEELYLFKKRHNSEFSSELNISVTMCIALLEMHTNISSLNDTVYITPDVFRKYYKACRDLGDKIIPDSAGNFDEWARAILSSNLTYAASLYASNPTLDDEEKEYYCRMALDYGRQCIDNVEILINNSPARENNDAVGLIAMIKAYNFRNMYVAARLIASDEADDFLKASLEERKSLLINFDGNTVDSKLYTNFEMEYCLNLIEYIEYYGKDSIEKFELRMYLDDIDSFIRKYEIENDTSKYIQKIASKRMKLEK